MPHPLGIESRTVAGMGPVEHVRLADSLGCSRVSLALAQDTSLAGLATRTSAYPAWSLREDAGLRRELRAALADTGVCVKIGEGLVASDLVTPVSRAADFDLFAEIGTRRVVARDNGLEREHALDQLAQFAEMARARGMDLGIAFAPVLTTRTLEDALDLVRAIGEDLASVTVDALHFLRAGGSPRTLSELDAALIGHVRLCDGLMDGSDDEARHRRMIPGEGELPLREFVDALPRGKTLGLDVSLPQAGLGYQAAADYIGEVVARTRALLA